MDEVAANEAYAILGQDARGLQWLANVGSVPEAREQIDPDGCSVAGVEYDAILVVPLAEFVAFPYKR